MKRLINRYRRVVPVASKEQYFGPLLSGSLTCFVTGFFFLNLYFSQVSNRSMYIGPSIIFFVIAIFFLFAILLADWCKRLFAWAQLTNDKYVITWLLLASMTRAFSGLKSTLDSAANLGITSKSVAIVIWFFIIYLLIYFIVLLIRFIQSASKWERPIFTRNLKDGILLILGMTIVLMISNQLTIPEYLTMIGFCIVLFAITIHRKRNAQSKYVLDAFIITTSAAILLGIGELLSPPFWWFWFCFSFFVSAFILLFIDMYYDYKTSRQYLIYDETVTECRELID